MKLEIKQNQLDRQYFMFREEYETKVLEILRSGWYILGPEVSTFEKEFAQYIGAKNCVGLASGLDALWISFRVLGIGTGDEVIVQANTYIASVMGITINGAMPVFVEPDQYYNIDVEKIEEKITSKTKAILVVHLYGQAARMDVIQDLCKKYNLYLIEDCAQSHGAKFNHQMTGSFGDVGCFSFYPSKNLGGFGDGGAITTNHDELAEKFKIFRNYGSQKRYHNEVVGANSRLDELQAGLLRIKLSHISEILKERELIAHRYLTEIKNPLIELPKLAENLTSVWHLFVVQCGNRDHFINYLQERGIQTLIHYPIPPHLSEAYTYLGYSKNSFPITEKYSQNMVSLPLFNGMKEEEIDYIVEVINEYE